RTEKAAVWPFLSDFNFSLFFLSAAAVLIFLPASAGAWIIGIDLFCSGKSDYLTILIRLFLRICQHTAGILFFRSHCFHLIIRKSPVLPGADIWLQIFNDLCQLYLPAFPGFFTVFHSQRSTFFRLSILLQGIQNRIV